MLEGDGPRGPSALTHADRGGRDGWRAERGVAVGDDLRRRAMESVVRRLASPAVDQIGFLERLEVGVEELALQFADLTTPLPRGLGVACRDVLADLDELLAEITATGRHHLLTFDALASAPEWASVRELAGTFLVELAVAGGPERL